MAVRTFQIYVDENDFSVVSEAKDRLSTKLGRRVSWKDLLIAGCEKL